MAANFNNSTPVAIAGYTNGTWQFDGSGNISVCFLTPLFNEENTSIISLIPGDILVWNGSQWINATPPIGNIDVNGVLVENGNLVNSASVTFSVVGSNISATAATGTFPVTIAAATSTWLNSYTSTTGLFTATQPTFTDLSAHPTTLSGYGITDALPSSTVLPVTAAATAHNWINSYTSSTGAFTETQPAAADLSDSASSAGYVLRANGTSFVSAQLGVADLAFGALANFTTATTQPNASDASTKVATDAFVQNAIELSMGTLPLNLGGLGPATYSFASLGSGALVNYMASGGVITSITVWVPFVGSGYKAGDLITVSGGNYDATIAVTAVAGGGYPTSGVILYGGTGYTSGTSIAAPAVSSIPFTFLLSGALSGNIEFLMSHGTYQTQSNQWIFCNNTTGAYTVTVGVSNSTNTGASGGRTVVIPQGSNNNRSVFIQDDGELNTDLAGVVNYADLGGLPTLAVTTSRTAHSFFTTYNAGTGAFGQAQPAVADLSDTPAAGQVLAGPATGVATTATFRALVQSDLPNQYSVLANLPNVKLIPIFQIFNTSTAPMCDFYTVPAGRRALLTTASATLMPQPYNSGSYMGVYLKVSGNYYMMAAPASAVVNAPTGSAGTTPGYIAEAGETLSLGQPLGQSTWSDMVARVTAVAAATTTSFTLTSAQAQINGLTEYIGTITSGGSNIFAGVTFVVSGFSNAGNNGTFVCVASTTTTLTLQNIGGVAETHAGTAAYTSTNYTIATGNSNYSYGNIVTVAGCSNAANNGTFQLMSGTGLVLNNPNGVPETPPTSATVFLSNLVSVNAYVIEFDNTAALRTSKILGPAASTSPQTVYTPSGSKNGLLVTIGTSNNSAGVWMSNPTTMVGSTAMYYSQSKSQTQGLTSASATANGLTSYAGNIPLGGSVALASTAATAIPAIYSGTITAVTAAGVYTGTFPINNAYVGQWVTISGFANPVNNGTFLCTASTTTTISLQTPFSVAASAQTGTMTLSAAYTCYTVAALAAPYMGQYFTVLGFTNAANNGTFQCVGGTGTTALYLTNTSGVTQTAQVATATLMPLYGVSITVSGFANAGNNGTFTCVGSTQHSLILSNAGGVAETNNASASFVAGSVPGTFMFNLTPSSIGVTTGAIGFNNTVANGDAITAIVLYPSVAPPQGFGGMIWTTVLEF